MAKKSLFDSNPYLKDPIKYRDSLISSVASSTAVETCTPVPLVIDSLNESLKTTKKKQSNPQ